jgi:hypothetical protein
VLGCIKQTRVKEKKNQTRMNGKENYE